MGMNNIFYRFHHLSSNAEYATMPARLRMNGLRRHGVDEVDFELWSLAVSAINGCGKCVDAHEKVVREKGATEELVAAIVRVPPSSTPSASSSTRSRPKVFRPAPPRCQTRRQSPFNQASGARGIERNAPRQRL